MTVSQFQPYRAGWVTSPARLALNTTALTTAVTAATAPSSADRTGTERPGSSALRVPTTIVAGRPAAAAARARADERGPAQVPRRPAVRTASTVSSPSSRTAQAPAPAPTTS